MVPAIFFAWSISKPQKNGAPTINSENGIDAIITTTFDEYKISLTVSDNVHATFKTKLWRMAKAFYKLGGTKRASQLEKWTDGDDSTWKLCISNTEVNAQLLAKEKTKH